MCVPALEVGYTLATTRKGDHEVYMGMVALEKKLLYNVLVLFYIIINLFVDKNYVINL
jgi:hypothetical protein